MEEISRHYLSLNHWAETHPFQGQLAAVLATVLFAILAHFLVRTLIVWGAQRLSARTNGKWDDTVVGQGVFNLLAHMAPGVVILAFAGPLPGDTATIRRLVNAYLLLVLTRVLIQTLNAAETLYSAREKNRSRSIKGYVQLAQMLLYLGGGLVVVATLMDRSPLLFVSGLGAASAILMLVFKDTLLSLVASVQIASNDMIRVGDWIEMPEYGADGDVLEVALHTVKVQNWDKTISTIPTSAFVVDGFKNWRGMSESGGRRIARSLNVDAATIAFVGTEELERMAKVHVLSEYIQGRCEEIRAWNSEHAGESVVARMNERGLTNIGIFRSYVLHYLKNHPRVNQGMTCLARQLNPTALGVPLQVYCFTKTVAWAEYEDIQGDIFDHLFAVISEFGLRVYQQPAGADFTSRGCRS